MEQSKKNTLKDNRVQEEERKRIAYELHDDTAQYLSILKMQLGALLQSDKIQSPELKEKLRYLEKDADRAFNDVRRYSHELRPVVLEHQGLLAALEQLADDINKLNAFKVELKVQVPNRN
jgi:two-component system NarL family sensor kinase